eukprot:gb/GECH01010113.1/.p1 GENE.gb/GECH01010113.1/~~gb/GECH01010113.1/.p1  ORF type:complete len:224 (+),score=48.00 gb/GECH01010113.1/:1-672(+)
MSNLNNLNIKSIASAAEDAMVNDLVRNLNHMDLLITRLLETRSFMVHQLETSVARTLNKSGVDFSARKVLRPEEGGSLPSVIWNTRQRTIHCANFAFRRLLQYDDNDSSFGDLNPASIRHPALLEYNPALKHHLVARYPHRTVYEVDSVMVNKHGRPLPHRSRFDVSLRLPSSADSCFVPFILETVTKQHPPEATDIILRHMTDLVCRETLDLGDLVVDELSE